MNITHPLEDIIARRYRIVARLGQGACGITYEAEDLTNYQRVALKALSLQHLTDLKMVSLFEREARILARLDHPAIPKYLDYFQEDVRGDRFFYLVRELIPGESLADLVARGWHLDELEVERIAVQVLKTLQYLHSLKPPIIHRDIKPHNLIRHPNGRIFLVDFGAVQEVYRNTLHQGSTFVGTLGYMPPEQFRGKAYPASDLYSLGATLLFLLTHRSPADLPQAGLTVDWSKVHMSPRLSQWLATLLEPAVEDRCASATTALQGLVRTRGTLTTRNPQPAKSRILLARSERALTVEIMPKQPEWKDSLASAISGLTSLAGVMLMSADLFYAKVIVPLAALLILPGAYRLRSRVRLYLEPTTLRYEWVFCGWCRRGEGHIERINLQSKRWFHKFHKFIDFDGYYEERDKFLRITYTVKGRTRQFVLDRILSTVEKEWLYAEIADFLGLAED